MLRSVAVRQIKNARRLDQPQDGSRPGRQSGRRQAFNRQEIAKHEAPTGFTYRDLETIPSADSRPVGFVARYAVGDDEAKVVFLILDMGQHAQRQAAKVSAVQRSKGRVDLEEPARRQHDR